MDNWKNYCGLEISESQTFLNELFKCYGKDRRAVGCIYECQTDDNTRIDALWEPHALFEVKKYTTKLEEGSKSLKDTIKQAGSSWWSYDPGIKAKDRCRYIVLFNFRNIVILEPARMGITPIIHLPFTELPENPNTFSFILGESVEKENIEALNQSAIVDMVSLIHYLKEVGYMSDAIYYFVIQNVYLMFLHHYGEFQEGETYLDALKSRRLLVFLKRLAQKKEERMGDHYYRSIPYITGELFVRQTSYEIVDPDESVYRRLIGINKSNWQGVTPLIFGNLFENLMEKERKHQGAFYTNEDVILRIVKPLIIDPFTEKLEMIETEKSKKQKIKLLQKLLKEISEYKFLDPACGSGNFLYVTYMELKKLESKIIELLVLSSPDTKLGDYSEDHDYVSRLSPLNAYGIDNDIRAVYLTKIVLHLAQYKANKLSKFPESMFSLKDLNSRIIYSDALVDTNEKRVIWPRVNAIIGNPPFRGYYKMGENKTEKRYRELLKSVFKTSGKPDLVCYWFLQVESILKQSQVRVGFVCTKQIVKASNRFVLINLLNKMKIVYRRMPWRMPSVVVEITVICMWNGDEQILYYEDEEQTGRIISAVQPDLRPKLLFQKFDREEINNRITKEESSVGLVLWDGGGFRITQSIRDELMSADVSNTKIIQRYLTASYLNKSIVGSEPEYLINFKDFDREEAEKYIKPFEIVERSVKKFRQDRYNKKRDYRKSVHTFWIAHRDRKTFFGLISTLSHYVITPRIATRREFIRVSSQVDQTIFDESVRGFALPNWYHFGVLQSDLFIIWNNRIATPLRDEEARFIDVEAYSSFPWISANNENLQLMIDIGNAGKEYQTYRDQYCQTNGLSRNNLSNSPSPEYTARKEALNSQVRILYGLTPQSSEYDIIERLFSLNQKKLVDPIQSISQYSAIP